MWIIALPSRSRAQFLALVAMMFLACGSIFAADQPPKNPAARPVNPAYVQIEDDPKLPRVLLLGDSISIGYTLDVRELLKGNANVHRPADNCGPTFHGLEALDKWLGDGKWDVIHFNFGLHDLRYLDEQGKNIDPSKGKLQVPPEKYEKNLREILARLKKTGAKLIWANTTPIPDGSPGRIQGDEMKYNQIAAKVMEENGIQTDDLHAVVEKNPKGQLPHNVHFTEEGYKELAQSVAASIEGGLKK